MFCQIQRGFDLYMHKKAELHSLNLLLYLLGNREIEHYQTSPILWGISTIHNKYGNNVLSYSY